MGILKLALVESTSRGSSPLFSPVWQLQLLLSLSPRLMLMLLWSTLLPMELILMLTAMLDIPTPMDMLDTLMPTTLASVMLSPRLMLMLLLSTLLPMELILMLMAMLDTPTPMDMLDTLMPTTLASVMLSPRLMLLSSTLLLMVLILIPMDMLDTPTPLDMDMASKKSKNHRILLKEFT